MKKEETEEMTLRMRIVWCVMDESGLASGFLTRDIIQRKANRVVISRVIGLDR